MDTKEPCCVICQTDLLSESVITLSCSHTFHKECIQEWINRRNLCPLCNTIADPTKPIRKLEVEDHLSQDLIQSYFPANASLSFLMTLIDNILYQSFDDSRPQDVKNFFEQEINICNPITCGGNEQNIVQCAKCRKFMCKHKIKRCSKCKQIRYCSKECQKADWDSHKSECQ